MELKYFLTVIAVVSLIPVNYVFAHHDICEICGTPSDTRFSRFVAFEIYVPAEHQDRVIAFLNDFNTNVSTSVVRETRTMPDAFFVDRNDVLYKLQGAVIFESITDAERTYNSLVSLTTVDRGSIEFGRIIITENTHHYPNPLPDVILNSDTKGERGNLDRYQIDHFP